MNALERRIAELEATGGRLDIALALADLDPELRPAEPPDLQERRAMARIEQSLRTAPGWMWERLLAEDAPYYRFLREAA